MNNWYRYDFEGNRRGPFDDDQFKDLVRQGHLLPDTEMETAAGDKGFAREVQGRFPTQKIPLEKKPFDWQQTQSPLSGQASSTVGTNCGNPVGPQSVVCMSCGAAPVGHRKSCHICGVSLNPEQIICIKCGAGINAPQNPGPNGGNDNTGNYGQAGDQNHPGMYSGNPNMNGGYAPYRPVSSRLWVYSVQYTLLPILVSP